MPPAEERTTCFFSATFPVEIQEFGATLLNRYIFMSVGIVGAANSDIEQRFYILPKKEKLPKVRNMVQ